MSVCKKNCLSLALLFSFVLFPCFALIPNSTVLSPVAGTWANPQPLIIDTQPGTEVFYSLNGEDPLKSGFAYDGPIMLEGTGNFSIQIVTVSAKDTSAITKIDWTVSAKEQLSFVPQKADQSFISLEKNVGIDVPSSVSWVSGIFEQTIPEDKFFNKGGKVMLYSNCDIVRYIPLLLKKGTDYYRYILRTGYTDKLRFSSPVPDETDIQFFSWNYIRLSDGKKVQYSIDGGAIKQTSSLIAVDRSKEHTISWKVLDEENSEKSFVIPAKPLLKGTPEKGFTNDCVTLSLDNSLYQFGYTSPDGNTFYSKYISIDTVTGDVASISTNLDIYYRGVKQGSLPTAFLIDRRIPQKPQIISTAKDGFSREDVKISFDTNDSIYYSLTKPSVSETGFATSTSFVNSVVNNSEFKLLTKDSITLAADPKYANLYTVYAYAKDIAGNCSDISSYSVVIDNHNFYVDSGTTQKERHGTKNAPFNTIEEAISAIKTTQFSLYLTGDFTVNDTININADCKIIGNKTAKITFKPNANLKLNNVQASIVDCTLEKYVPQTGDVVQKNLLQIYDSSFYANNCDFVCNFDFAGSCITAKNSFLEIENSNLSSTALSYSSLFNIEDTELTIKNLKTVSSAKTAVGISATGNVCTINNVEFKIAGSLIRAIELNGVILNVQNSIFDGQSSNALKPAIWMDSYSAKRVDYDNKFSGFSVLSFKGNF